MTNLTNRAAAYVKAAFGGREIHTDPEGHEPGFYHAITPRTGEPYFAKVAYLVTAEEARRAMRVFHPLLIDVTGDSDRILKVLD